MKKAFTLIEIIFVIVILGIISTLLLTSILKYYKNFEQNNRFSTLNNESRMAIEYLDKLLNNRLSYSMIGYNPETGVYQSLYNIDDSYKVFEWISYSSECLDREAYKPFIDLTASIPDNIGLNVPYLDQGKLNECLTKKWDQNKAAALSFSGLFDEGEIKDESLFQDYFGWHGGAHNLIFTIKNISNNFIYLDEKPLTIYERFYLVDSSYAIARGEDIDLNAQCIQDLNLRSVNKDTLFIFSNYRSWNGETFCADINGNASGDVSILLQNTRGFRISLKNNQPVVFLNAKDNDILISKEKVIF